MNIEESYRYDLPEKIRKLLEEYRRAIIEVFKQQEIRIILYGSYARGDFHFDSDVDILVLADMESEEVSCYADKLYDVTYDFETRYDVEINPIVQSTKIYEQWKNTYPLFLNVEKKGIVL